MLIKVPEVFNGKTNVLVLTVLCLTAGFATSASALELGGNTVLIKSSAVRGIEAMCAEEADGIARNPGAEPQILGLLRDGFANIKKRKDGSKGIPEAIGIIRGAAIAGIGRNPSAEAQITSLVKECELALDRLGKFSFPL